MKTTLYNCLFVIAITTTLSLTSCATICGGEKYNAEVIVDNHPKAEITYNGQFIGTGRANIQIQRRNANKIIFTVKEDGKKEQHFAFQSRVFRGWSLVGTILLWTGYYQGIYLPWGIALDGITGSWWKPDDNEQGIIKVNNDNYRYFLRYDAEDDGSNKPSNNTQQTTVSSEASIETRLKQINNLKERGLISDEEYNKMRESIINSF